MSKKPTIEEVAHRVIRVLSTHPDIARAINPFDAIKDPKRYRDTLKDAFEGCEDIDQFAGMILTEDISVTFNPDMADNIYLEVSGDPAQKEFIFDAIEALDGKLKQALGLSKFRLVTIDMPEIEPQPAPTYEETSHGYSYQDPWGSGPAF